MKPEDEEIGEMTTCLKSGDEKFCWNEKWENEIKKRPIFDVGHIEIAADIVAYLGSEKLYELLEKFFYKVQNCFPKQFHENFLKNEIFLMGMIELKLWKKEFHDVYTLIENGKFSDPETLISIWDKAHYCEKQNQTGKTTLSPVTKFRIRERYPPPTNICPNGIRSGHCFPKSTQKVLKDWLEENLEHPFPSRQEMEEMAVKTGLSLQQVRNWFSNARRRSPEKRKRTNNNDNNKYRAPTTRRTNLLQKLLKCGNEKSDVSYFDQQQNVDQIAKKDEISFKDAPNKDLIQNQIIIVYVPVCTPPPPSDSEDVTSVILPPLTSGQMSSCHNDGSTSVDSTQDEFISVIVKNNNNSSFEDSEFSSQIYCSDINQNIVSDEVLVATESDSHLLRFDPESVLTSFLGTVDDNEEQN